MVANEVQRFSVTVPANTLIAAPQITDLAMRPGIVRQISVRVPPGPNGLVGFALGSAGVRVIPWGANQWIIENDARLQWPLSGQIESGAWQCQAYNSGTKPHTLQIEFLLDPIVTEQAVGAVVPLTITP